LIYNQLMDETTAPKPPETDSQSDEHAKRLVQLDYAKRILFDDKLARQQAEEILEQAAQETDPARRRMYETDAQTLIDPSGLMKQKNRARDAFNNLNSVLPGLGGRLADEDPLPADHLDRSVGDFRRDFKEAAAELGIDITEVEKLNDDPMPEGDEDPEFKLYKFIYPVIEKLVIEKDYPVQY